MVPTEVIIELTKKCNLNCDFCYHTTNDDVKLSKEDIFEILKDTSDSGINAIRFTGGEPFLRNDLNEIFTYAKYLGLYVILNTNGFLINKTNLECLKNIDLILFSLHDVKRTKTIKEKMNLLKDSNLKIMLATIIHKDNIKILDYFYDFVFNISQNNFVEWFLLRPIPKSDFDLTKSDINELYNKVIKYNNKYRMDIKIANSLPFCSIPQELYKLCRGGKFDCGRTRIMIDAEGNYRLDYSSEESFGNISNLKILDVWNSEYWKKIRNNNLVHEKCKTCSHLNICRGGFLTNENLI